MLKALNCDGASPMSLEIQLFGLDGCVPVYIDVCICIYMYVCVCVYACVYVDIFVHVRGWGEREREIEYVYYMLKDVFGGIYFFILFITLNVVTPAASDADSVENRPAVRSPTHPPHPPSDIHTHLQIYILHTLYYHFPWCDQKRTGLFHRLSSTIYSLLSSYLHMGV